MKPIGIGLGIGLGIGIGNQRADSLRNLLTLTERFDDAAWTKALVAITPNASVAPDSTTTADQAVYAGGAGDPTSVQLQQPAQIPGGTASKTLTFSVYVAAVSGTQTIRLKNTHVGVLDNFSTDFTVGTTFERVSFAVTNGAGAGNGAQIAGIVAGAANAAFDVYVWGAQLEIGPSATAYQRVV